MYKKFLKTECFGLPLWPKAKFMSQTHTIAPFKAILFDFDGTLVDSEKIHFDAWNEVLKDYGLAVDYNSYLKKFAGIPTILNAERLIEENKLDISVEEIVEKGKEIFREHIGTKDPEFMPHALETLRFFYKKRLPMALVTGSPREQVDPILKNKDLEKFFRTTITYDDVANSKPDPEGYLKAAAFLGFSKEEYLVFEDTATGTKAAKAAGLTCYAIQTEAGIHQNLSHADRIFLNLSKAL